MAADGTVLDIPDTPANAKVFGYPGSPKGTRAAFPKIRLVLLVEAGTLGFTGSLKVIRAAIPEFQHLSSEQLPFFGHG